MLHLLLLLQGAGPADVVAVRGDDVVIRSSCRVEIPVSPIRDGNGDGVIQIPADGVVVDFAGAHLHGAEPGLEPDGFTGIGVRVTGKDVTIRGARISGFKGGIWASGADGLVVEDCDVSGNFRQRLRSSEAAEDASDWLWPHENDENQWLWNYGAGIYVEASRGVTVRRSRARRGQNGLCLRAVESSRVYDNDFSFLSGWGLAMFRSSRNVVDHNSFDFCVRGYSHGVYARGQDSAGILFFEQCRDNLFAHNSATHGGDGFFGYAGNEALASSERPGLGNTGNLLYRNDFSYAPAIGIEMTFSFDNRFVGNRLNGSNYGVWGGYSSNTLVLDNEIHDNVIAGIAVEHGSGWTIAGNDFARNRRAIQLWWDEDADLLARPWAKLNPTQSRDHRILENRFRDDTVLVELRGGTTGIVAAKNDWQPDPERMAIDEASELSIVLAIAGAEPAAGSSPDLPGSIDDPRLADLPGTRQAVGARPELEGRDKIIMTEWGPYDWQGPHLKRLADRGADQAWRLLGAAGLKEAHASGDVEVAIEEGVVRVGPGEPGRAARYELTVETTEGTLVRRGVIVPATWRVRAFPWTSDPREDLEAWRGEARGGVEFELPRLKLAYGGGGPSQLEGAPEALAKADIPKDRFGTTAETVLRLPAGRWRIVVTSDDGVRLWADGELLIDDWTWHAPRTEAAELEIAQEREVALRVEHFELDGYAVLDVRIEAVEQ